MCTIKRLPNVKGHIFLEVTSVPTLHQNNKTQTRIQVPEMKVMLRL